MALIRSHTLLDRERQLADIANRLRQGAREPRNDPNGVAEATHDTHNKRRGSCILVRYDPEWHYNLQSSTNLNATNWTTLTTTSNQFTTPAAGALQFFRLVKPGA